MSNLLITSILVNGALLRPDLDVKIYRNLHRDCFSVLNRKTRTVCAYSKKIWLKDVEFKVSEAGRQRVIASKKKNVHAFVTGKIFNPPFDFQERNSNYLEYVWYNPYTTPFFKLTDSTVVHNAKFCLLKDNKIWILR